MTQNFYSLTKALVEIYGLWWLSHQTRNPGFPIYYVILFSHPHFLIGLNKANTVFSFVCKN